MKNLTKKLSEALIGAFLLLGTSTIDADAQCLFRGGSQASFRRDYSYSSRGYYGGHTYVSGGNANVAIPYYNHYVPSPQPQPVFNNFQAPNPTIEVKVPEGFVAYVTDPNGRNYAISYEGYPNQGNYNPSYNAPSTQYYQETPNYILDNNRNGIDDRQEYSTSQPTNYVPDVNYNGVDDRRERFYYQQNNTGPVRGVVGGTVIVGGSILEGVGVLGRVVGHGVEAVGAGVESLGRGARHAGERVYYPYPPQRVNHPYRY